MTLVNPSTDLTYPTASLTADWEYARNSHLYEVLRDRPMALWRLDETVGPTAFDLINSNRNSGTFTGSTTWASSNTPTPNGVIANFDGSTAYVDLTAVMPTIAPQPAFSIGAWFKTSSATLQTIIRHSTSGIGIQINGATTGAASGFFYDQGNTQRSVTSTASYIDGQWHHVALTYDGTTELLYVDGAQVATRTITATGITYGNTGMAIGRLGDTNSTFFNGSLSHVALYNYAVPAARVLAQYKAGKAIGTPVREQVVQSRHANIRSFSNASVSVPFTMLDMKFWNVGYFKTMNMGQLKTGFATNGTESWTSNVGGTTFTNDATLRSAAVVTMPLTTGNTGNIQSLTGTVDINTGFGSTGSIQLVLRNFPAQTDLAHCDLAHSYLDLSSDATMLTQLDRIPFSSSTVSLTAGGNVNLSLPKSLFVNCNLSSIKAVRIWVAAITPTPPTAPSAVDSGVANGGSGPSGTYLYVTTFTSATGETTASPPSASVTVAAHNISVSAIQVGPNGTTNRKLYRASIGAGLFPGAPTAIPNPSPPTGDDVFPGAPGDGIYRLVTTVAGNSTTTYTDTASDASIAGAASPPVTNTAGAMTFSASSLRYIETDYVQEASDIQTRRGLLARNVKLDGTEWYRDAAPMFMVSSAQPKHLTEVIKFNSGTLPPSTKRNSVSLIARYDASTGQNVRVLLASGPSATDIKIYDNDVLINSQSFGALTANTDYFFQVQFDGSNCTATVLNSRGAFFGSQFCTTGAQTVSTRRGYVGIWFQPYTYDFTVDFVKNTRVTYAQFESAIFPSATPVKGATLATKTSDRVNRIGSAVFTNSGDGALTSDLNFGIPAPSNKMIRTGAGWYGGMETTATIDFGDPKEGAIVGDIFTSNVRGKYRVALMDPNGSIGYLREIPNIVPGKWVHFEIPLQLSLVPAAYKLLFHQTGFYPDTFRLDNVQLLSHSISWEASIDGGANWQPFLDAINSKYSAIHFETPDTRLKVRGSALDPAGWIQGYQIVPRYLIPGHHTD